MSRAQGQPMEAVLSGKAWAVHMNITHSKGNLCVTPPLGPFQKLPSCKSASSKHLNGHPPVPTELAIQINDTQLIMGRTQRGWGQSNPLPLVRFGHMMDAAISI